MNGTDYKREASNAARHAYDELVVADKAVRAGAYGLALRAMHSAGMWQEAVTWNVLAYERSAGRRSADLTEWLGATTRALDAFTNSIIDRLAVGKAAGRRPCRPRPL